MSRHYNANWSQGTSCLTSQQEDVQKMRSFGEFLRGMLEAALDGRPNYAEVRSILSSLEEEGADSRSIYEEVVADRAKAFPEWPQAPSYEELKV